MFSAPARVRSLVHRFDDTLLFEPHPNRSTHLLGHRNAVALPHFLQSIEEVFVDAEGGDYSWSIGVSCHVDYIVL
jgi:hypothetical protein